MDRKRVLGNLAYLLAVLGLLLAVVPATMIHQGRSGFVWVKVGLGMLVGAAICGALSLRRGSSETPAPPPSAYQLAIVGLIIPPVAYATHLLQVAAVGISFLVTLAALIKVVIELLARKQWRWPATWIGLALCLSWPLVMKIAPCFDRDPIIRQFRAADGPRCHEEFWGR